MLDPNTVILVIVVVAIVVGGIVVTLTVLETQWDAGYQAGLAKRHEELDEAYLRGARLIHDLVADKIAELEESDGQEEEDEEDDV